MKRKLFPIIYIVLFFLICTLPLFTMLLPQKKFLLENRVLSSMPEIIKERSLNTNFPDEFNTYFSENFGLRPYLVTAYSKLNYSLFNTSVNKKVIAGKNNWLYFNETIADYTGENQLTDKEIERLYRILYLQQEYLRQHGINFIFTIAPNKNSVYGEFMPSTYLKSTVKSNLQLVNAYFSDKELSYVNLFNALIKSKSELRQESDIALYHKTDTHWNNYGAKIAYNQLMQKAKEQLPDYSYEDYSDKSYTKRNDWNGDLKKMLFPTSKSEDEQFYYDISKQFTYTRPLRSSEDLNIISNSSTNHFRLFMIRDSFANSLIQYISNNFGYARYSRILPVDYDIIINDKPDIVIMEIVERNIPSLLEQAPIMPAPERSELKGIHPTLAKDLNVVVKTNEYGEYLKILGFVNTSDTNSLNNKTVYIKIINGSNEYFFEPFPVLEATFKNSIKLNEESDSLGFSMLLDKSYISDKNCRIQIIINTEDNYISSTSFLIQ